MAMTDPAFSLLPAKNHWSLLSVSGDVDGQRRDAQDVQPEQRKFFSHLLEAEFDFEQSGVEIIEGDADTFVGSSLLEFQVEPLKLALFVAALCEFTSDGCHEWQEAVCFNQGVACFHGSISRALALLLTE